LSKHMAQQAALVNEALTVGGAEKPTKAAGKAR
jgi:hypothetical protein